MKFKTLLLAVFCLAVAYTGIAQSKTNVSTPEALVKNLYAAQKGSSNPFFQYKKRALLDQYFAKDLADMLWKDAVDAKGEIGGIDFDPLVGSQDSQVTNLIIGKSRSGGGPDNAFVEVTFKNFGKPDKVDFELQREAGKPWKIIGIYYGNGEDLVSTLRYWQDEEFKKAYENDHTFTGEYMIGKAECTVTPTLGGFKYRVECANQEGFKLYMVEGTETETAYIHADGKSKFLFKNGQPNGKFIDAAGKEVKVSKVK